MTTLPDAARAKLEAIVGPRHVLTSFVDRLAYNNDCWPRGIILARGRALRRHMPACIVQPANTQEVQALIQWARDADYPIVAFGAGSGVCGGTVVEDGRGVVMDLKRMKSIHWTNKEDMLMRADSGIIGMNMERELQRRGLTLGHYPSSILCSSLGGYLAARSAGQYSSLYGKIEDMVHSMEVVTGEGEIIETGRLQASGPDWNQLVIGSEGTMGIITASTLHLKPQPKTHRYAGFHFDSIEHALEAIQRMMQQGIRPAVVRLYDEFDTLINKGTKRPSSGNSLSGKLLDRVSAWFGDLTETSAEEVKAQAQQRVEAVAQGMMTRVLGQPYMLNKLVDGLPYSCLLIVGFEGEGAAFDAQVDWAMDMFGREGKDLGEGPGLHWLENRYNVSYKQSAMYAAGAFVDTMEVSTTWDNLTNLYRSVREALAEHVFVMAHFSHMYPEGASIYFTMAGAGKDMDDTMERYARTWEAGLSAVAAAGASTAHHHGVGLAKARWSSHDHKGGWPHFKALKDSFDPDGIMNPGKVYLPQPIKVHPEASAPTKDVMVPKTRRELKEIVRGAYTNERACAFVSRSSTAQYHHALRASPKPLVVEMNALDDFLDLDRQSLIAHVESGMTWEAFGKHLSARGVGLMNHALYPHDASIGGLLAAPALRTRVLHDSSLEDNLVSIEAISPAGDYQYLPAPRKSSGPDLRHLFLGTQGQHGPILSARIAVSAQLIGRLVLLDAPTLADAQSAWRAASALHLPIRWTWWDSAKGVLALGISLSMGLVEPLQEILSQAFASTPQILDHEAHMTLREDIEGNHPASRTSKRGVRVVSMDMPHSALGTHHEALDEWFDTMWATFWSPHGVQIYGALPKSRARSKMPTWMDDFWRVRRLGTKTQDESSPLSHSLHSSLSAP